MRETEIEVEEKEVEKVYCDDCGDECTDDHSYETKEVCPSCADGFTVFETAKDALEQVNGSEYSENLTIGWAIAFIIIAPIVYAVTIHMHLEENSDNLSREAILQIIIYTLGSILWTLIVVFVLFFL